MFLIFIFICSSLCLSHVSDYPQTDSTLRPLTTEYIINNLHVISFVLIIFVWRNVSLRRGESGAAGLFTTFRETGNGKLWCVWLINCCASKEGEFSKRCVWTSIHVCVSVCVCVCYQGCCMGSERYKKLCVCVYVQLVSLLSLWSWFGVCWDERGSEKICGFWRVKCVCWCWCWEQSVSLRSSLASQVKSDSSTRTNVFSMFSELKVLDMFKWCLVLLHCIVL